VNAFRKQNGKEPLAWEESLYKISTEHSNDMASGFSGSKRGSESDQERSGVKVLLVRFALGYFFGKWRRQFVMHFNEANALVVMDADILT